MIQKSETYKKIITKELVDFALSYYYFDLHCNN